MTTIVTRKGRTGRHQLHKIWKQRNAEAAAEVYARDQAEEARIKAEDEEIRRHRELFPLH